MILGLLAAAAGTVAHPFGAMIGMLARLPLGYLEGLAQRLARSPLPSVTSMGGHLLELVAGLTVVAGLAWWIRSGAREHVPSLNGKGCRARHTEWQADIG